MSYTGCLKTLSAGLQSVLGRIERSFAQSGRLDSGDFQSILLTRRWIAW